MALRIAVVGLAGVGRTHVAEFEEMEQFELAGICDTDTDVLESVAANASVTAYSSAEAMFETHDLDAVSICTPPKSHLPLTEMAARSGVHVLCEKPMASTVEQCDGMIEACRQTGVTLMIAHKKRFLPVVARLRELMDGPLGPISYLLHRYPHPGMSQKDWFWAEDDGGGPVVENAVHAADLVRHLMGDVETVSAEGGAFFAPERAPQLDCAVYTLRFGGGGIGTVGCGMVSTPKMSHEDVFVAGQNGVAEIGGGFDSADRLVYVLRSEADELHEETFADSAPFRAEFEHFHECVEEGREPLTSGAEGREAIRLCLAVKESARTGQAVRLSSQR
ncbi:MAG: Gfo/Idh/MocA family oxidoreductase [Armatimonadota bacterium]|jgi:predicted dehydrogenase